MTDRLSADSVADGVTDALDSELDECGREALGLIPDDPCRPKQWDVSNGEYHADLTHESSSTLKRFLNSPPAYWHERVKCDVPRSGPTGSMRLGSALDIALLEPEKFRDLVQVAPDITGYKTYDAQKFQAMAAELPPDGVLLTAADGEKLPLMIAGVRMVPEAVKLLEAPGSRQTSLRWTDAEIGIGLKVRFDGILDNGHIFDLKTTRDPYPGAFSRQANDLLYHMQAELYSHARDLWLGFEQGQGGHSIIAVGSEWPFECMVHRFNKASLAAGLRLWRYAASEIARLRQSHGGRISWPSEYQGQVNLISIPPWGLDKEYLR